VAVAEQQRKRRSICASLGRAETTKLIQRRPKGGPHHVRPQYAGLEAVIGGPPRSLRSLTKLAMRTERPHLHSVSQSRRRLAPRCPIQLAWLAERSRERPLALRRSPFGWCASCQLAFGHDNRHSRLQKKLAARAPSSGDPVRSERAAR